MNKFKVTRDRERCINLFKRWNHEIDPSIERFPGKIEGTVDMFLERGNIIIGGVKGKEKGVLGYIIGEPSNNFSDKSIGYVYLVIVPEEHRNGRTFYRLVQSALHEIEGKGATEVRFKSYKTHQYNNDLYKKIATVIGEEDNSQGVPSILYSATIEDLKERFL